MVSLNNSQACTKYYIALTVCGGKEMVVFFTSKKRSGAPEGWDPLSYTHTPGYRVRDRAA